MFVQVYHYLHTEERGVVTLRTILATTVCFTRATAPPHSPPPLALQYLCVALLPATLPCYSFPLRLNAFNGTVNFSCTVRHRHSSSSRSEDYTPQRTCELWMMLHCAEKPAYI
jgi:hypothetical protein